MQPAHTPLQEGADRIAGLLIHLERTFAPSLTLTTLAVKRWGGVSALVIVHLDDGTREHLDSGEARLMARCLRDDHGEAEGQQAAWAASLDDAAEAADRQAGAMLMGLDASRNAGFGPAAAHPAWRDRA